jgi:diguanylate cyclase (GGDEF)-like protein
MAFVVALPTVMQNDLEARALRAERRAQREHTARIEAEAIAERGLRDLYESQQRLLLLHRITDGANHSSDINTALRLAVTEVCQYMGWAFGNAYIRNGNTVVGCDTWYAADDNSLFGFVELSRRYRFVAGSGLPGRVLTDVRPHWIEDVTQDTNFLRARAARTSGLHAGCAFPVMVGEEVAAVLEFFSRERLVQDEALLTIMGQIGTQLGRVIERERARLALLHDALHDPLTGLPNRTLFADRLKNAVARASGSEGTTTAVMVVDLDGFKGVNDTLGHQAGDRLLVDTAKRIDDCLRRNLAASRGFGPRHATLARMGGDEFTILIEDVRHGAAEAIAEAVRNRLAGDRDDRISGNITASIGIAYDDGRYEDVELLLRDADLAMYEAKANGRNQAVTFGERIGRQIRQRLVIEQQIREALARHEFVLHYQPIVELSRPDRVQGFEALVRWNHPTRGLIGPDQFIPIAEESGLILFLGDWVLREACRTTARWQRENGESSPFISINISPCQFLQPDFARQVHAALLETGVEPTSVRLEVTEGAAIQDADRTRAVIEEIRSWGVSTSLDDFGTGYSSLSHIQRLPFDVLKIDRSFVAPMTGNADHAKATGIVQAILDLARTLNMRVVAEGIETEAQAAILSRLGCTHGQGYLFSRPVPAEDAKLIIGCRASGGL